jgi:phosphoglycolate phosphatase
MKLYGSALRKTYEWLVDQGVVEPRELSDEEISRWLGWQVEDMWTTFVPGIEEQTWKRASKMVGDTMRELLMQGKGALFEGVDEMLNELRTQGFDLVFLSNCGRSYCDDYLREFGIDHLFAATYCAAEFGFIPKWQIYQLVADQHPKPHIMVGDRFHDMEVAEHAGILSIGCAYGYGELSELKAATVVVDSPGQIVQAIQKIRL